MTDFRFEGGYSAIPNNLVGFLSANAISVFAKLVQCAALQDRKKRSAAYISVTQLAKILRAHRTTVYKAIEELSSFDIIRKIDDNPKSQIFIINWEDVKLICEALNKMDIFQATLFKRMYAEFISDYLYKICTNTPDLYRKCTNNEDLYKKCTNIADLYKKCTNTPKSEKDLYRKCTNNEDLYKICTNNCVVYTEDGRVFVQKSTKTIALAENLDESLEESENISDFEADESEMCTENVQINAGFVQKMYKSSGIYNKKNKKNCGTSEASPGEGEDRVEKGIIGLIGGVGGRRGKREKEERGEETSYSNFSQVEIIDFDQPSESTENFSERSRERKENFQEYKKQFAASPYSQKPYFNKQEVERFTADIELCTNSPVKLFLYNFWDELYAFCEENRIAELPADEHGEETERPEINLLGCMIPSEEILSMMERAYQDMTEIARAGFVEMEYGKVTIGFQELSDFDPTQMLDWKIVRDEDNTPSFIVSYDGIRNIEAQDIQVSEDIKAAAGDRRAESRINRGFIQAVLKSPAESLTPMEKAIRLFCETLLRFDEVGHTVGFKNMAGMEMEGNTLPGFIIKPWTLNLQALDITPQDFYGTMAVPYKDGADLKLKSNLFSFQKAHNWNQMHGYDSKISPLSDF